MVTAVVKKSRLAYYGTVMSLLLSFSVFSPGFNLSTLLTFAAVLPLPLYFALQSVRLYRKLKSTHLPSTIDHQPSKFSIREFLAQPSFTFRLSLVLFIIVGFTTLARLR